MIILDWRYFCRRYLFDAYIPNIKKQDEVGLFLSKLHQELKCETWILMQLKSQKNYLLNNMFI